MKTFSEIFNGKYGDNLKNSIEIIDNVCVKLDIDPIDFWIFYYGKKGDFSGDDFFKNFLEYFLFYLETQANQICKKYGVDIFGWFHSDNNIIVLTPYAEFSKLRELPFNSKKELIENKILNYLIDESGKDIFSDKEKRRIKLESINFKQKN